MSLTVPPIAKAIYLCDDAVGDPAIQKISLFGIFNSVRPSGSPPYPFHLARICVFAQLVGGIGEVPIRVELVNSRTGEPLYRAPEQTIRFPSRATTVSVLFRILNCEFSAAGVYTVEMFCGGIFMDDRTLHLQ